MQKYLSEIKQKSEKKKRTCMFDSCHDIAIKSHVLQKNGILRDMSVDNHLIERVSTNFFEIQEKGISDFKRVGVNNVFTFNGFCQRHDSEIFKSIETDKTLCLDNPNQQLLFCYRGLCQEIRRKEIAYEWISDIRNVFPKEYLLILNSLADGYIDGLKNLNYFKTELEECIKSKNSDKFYFETLEIDRIELCISVPLNVGELEIPEENNYEKWRNNKKIPFTTSFINVFPKGSSSYVIVGFHKEFPCQWTINLIEKIKKSNKKEILKELSDLVSLRLEFWALSLTLFDKIDKEEIKIYEKLIEENVFNHSEYMKTEINLFKSIE